LQNDAFNELKQQMVNTPVLVYPKRGCQYVLDTDASNFAVGAVLSQIQDGVERPIAYGSKAMHDGQLNYCTTYKELLAVVIFTKQFEPYLYGQPFVLRTDHAALTWLQNFKKPEGMLARWLATLQQCNFVKIEHRAGTKHTNADSLSRIKSCGRLSCPDHTAIAEPVKEVTLSQPIKDFLALNKETDSSESSDETDKKEEVSTEAKVKIDAEKEPLLLPIGKKGPKVQLRTKKRKNRKRVAEIKARIEQAINEEMAESKESECNLMEQGNESPEEEGCPCTSRSTEESEDTSSSEEESTVKKGKMDPICRWEDSPLAIQPVELCLIRKDKKPSSKELEMYCEAFTEEQIATWQDDEEDISIIKTLLGQMETKPPWKDIAHLSETLKSLWNH
jgi:hypothetical protein